MPDRRLDAIHYSNTSVQNSRRPVPWIWDGVVAEVPAPLLPAPERPATPTLLSLLLDRRRGGQLRARAVRPGGTTLCSEESCTLWELPQPPLDFGPQLEYHKPVGGPPTPRRWRRYIDHLLGLGDDAFHLLLIAPVLTFL